MSNTGDERRNSKYDRCHYLDGGITPAKALCFRFVLSVIALTANNLEVIRKLKKSLIPPADKRTSTINDEVGMKSQYERSDKPRRPMSASVNEGLCY